MRKVITITHVDGGNQEAEPTKLYKSPLTLSEALMWVMAPLAIPGVVTYLTFIFDK